MLTANADVLDPFDPPTYADPVPQPPDGEWSGTPSASLAEAARYCHSLAVALNANAFSLLLCARQEEAMRLVPVFDSAFPGVAPLSRTLGARSCAAAAGIFAAATPAWWRDAREPSFLAASARRWAREIDSAVDGTSGIAFPVSTERSRTGVVVFAGAEMSLDEVALCETHARCHAVFAGVVEHHSFGDEPVPVMSKRELECLRLTANGLTSEEIAAALKLSVHTANQYLTNSTHKLNAVNRIHAVAKALRCGLID